MGLMDKFKNLFTDEEIVEEEVEEPIEIKEVKKEEEPPKLPTFMREKIEKEEREQEFSTMEFDVHRELKLEKKIETEVSSESKNEDKSTFKFPIDINDNDFVETRSRQSRHAVNKEPVSTLKTGTKKENSVKNDTKVASLYKDKKKEKVEEEKKFRATPIISPIYGVLDKNYSPTDVESSKGKNLEEKRHSKSVDFDSVRKKAYGSLTDDIRENLMCENCEYLKEAKECKNKQKESNLVYDVLEDDNEEVEDYSNDITLDEATENYYDYGVEYEKEVPKVYSEEVKIVNHEEQAHPKKEIPPVKSSINLLSTLKKSMGDEVESPEKKNEDLELTDDLFNLIDSMYDERNDNE